MFMNKKFQYKKKRKKKFLRYFGAYQAIYDPLFYKS